MISHIKRSLVRLFKGVLLIPHYILFLRAKNKDTILADFHRWEKLLRMNSEDNIANKISLLADVVEFRNLFYVRMIQDGMHGFVLSLAKMVRPPLQCLLIDADKSIGPGFFIQHGLASVIGHESIGKNCWVNQQVTIGARNGGRPIIGDNVTIGAGAKVLGGIRIGNNVIIGANAVVIRDVPDNCVVAGVPARIIRKVNV